MVFIVPIHPIHPVIIAPTPHLSTYQSKECFVKGSRDSVDSNAASPFTFLLTAILVITALSLLYPELKKLFIFLYKYIKK